MNPTRFLFFGLLAAAGALVFGSGVASAAEPETTPSGTPIIPPDDSTEDAAESAPSQAGSAGVQCRDAFRRWKSLSDQALGACALAAELAIEWFDYEEARTSPFYSAAVHEQIRAEWEAAQTACENLNAQALSAMGQYEACMTSIGLDPSLPSAATMGLAA